MQKILIRGLSVAVAVVFVIGLVPSVVFAHEGSDDSDNPTTTTAATETETENEDSAHSGTELKDRIEKMKQLRKEINHLRLDANKLRVCEQRQTKVKAIMNRASLRAERQLAVFTKIADRVEAFYKDKGRTVSNYDELVAAVDAAKAKAQANLEVLKDLKPFDCTGNDPKGDVEAFKLALQSINSDLKDYRTSIKNLIVAVKSAQSTTAKEEGGEQ